METSTQQQQQQQQEPCGGMDAPPKPEHEWLHKMIGTWKGQGAMGDMTSTVIETVRSIGGLWVVAEGQITMPDGDPATTIMTLGYEPGKGSFVGTFIGSMMYKLWVYNGVLDLAANKLTLNARGPAMTPEMPETDYQDVIEFQGDDQRTLTSLMLMPDGTWNQFMVVTYTRMTA